MSFNISDMTPLQWKLAGACLAAVAINVAYKGYENSFERVKERAAERELAFEEGNGPVLVPARAQRKADIANGNCKKTASQTGDSFECPTITLLYGKHTYTYQADYGQESIGRLRDKTADEIATEALIASRTKTCTDRLGGTFRCPK
jgi:hypothetical protein